MLHEGDRNIGFRREQMETGRSEGQGQPCLPLIRRRDGWAAQRVWCARSTEEVQEEVQLGPARFKTKKPKGIGDSQFLTQREHARRLFVTGTPFNHSE